MIFLDGNAGAALSRAAAREGPEWLDWYIRKLARHGVRPEVHDVASAAKYLRRERAVTLSAARRQNWGLISDRGCHRTDPRPGAASRAAGPEPMDRHEANLASGRSSPARRGDAGRARARGGVPGPAPWPSFLPARLEQVGRGLGRGGSLAVWLPARGWRGVAFAGDGEELRAQPEPRDQHQDHAEEHDPGQGPVLGRRGGDHRLGDDPAQEPGGGQRAGCRGSSRRGGWRSTRRR